MQAVSRRSYEAKRATVWQMLGGEAVDVFINVLGHGDHTCFLGGAVVDANDGMADVLGALDVRPVTGAVVADDGAIATHVDIGFDVASATCADSDA